MSLDWSKVSSVKTLDELNDLEAIKRLKSNILYNGFSRARVGFSIGTGFVSFSLRISSVESGKVCQEKESLIANYYDEWIANSLKIMLCRHENKDEISSDTVNKLIETFAKRTGVALCDLKWNQTTGGLRCVFCSESVVNDRLSGKNLWRYSPSYKWFFNDQNKFDSTSAIKVLVNEMIEDIWVYYAKQHYMVDPCMKGEFDQKLREYFEGGISPCNESFQPSNLLCHRFGFYLQGGAGVGKSTFTSILGEALQYVFRKYLNPFFQVSVVKLPLNSITPSNLQHILKIQGISDWSVERMVEQSIAKGNICILHIEETPPDLQTQADMFEMIGKMLSHLMGKYPEKPGNVIYAFTSNYQSCKSIDDVCGIKLMVSAPSEQAQFEWAKLLLKNKVCRHASSFLFIKDIEFVNLPKPPYTNDMRFLNHWWLSLGFYVLKYLKTNKNTNEDEDKVAVVTFEQEDLQHKYISIKGGGYKLQSKNGYFYTDIVKTMNDVVIEMAIQNFITPAVIVNNFSSSPTTSFSPERERKQQEKDLENLVAICKSTANTHLRMINIGQLYEESQKVKIYGSPSQIRGGLFEFIDDTTNPHIAPGNKNDCLICGLGNSCTADPKSSIRVCAVFASVSAVGQFMLRELIEPSERSKTHRISIRKNHLIFFLSTIPGEELTSQTISRSHVINEH